MTDTLTTNGTGIGGQIPTSLELDRMERVASHLSVSGLFKDVKSETAAFAKMLYGRDMGLSASAAMTGLHIVEGKPELSANLQAQLVSTYTGPDGERYRFRVREHDNTRCAIEFQIREKPDGEWEPLGTSVYTMDDAAAAGLNGKGVWKKHPRNMLWARAMSDGVNFYCPEVARGLRVYHEGELSVNGPLIEDVAPVIDEPYVMDAIPLVSDEQAATILAGVQLLAEHNVKVGTYLVSMGAVQGANVEATVRTLPAAVSEEVCGWLSAKLDEVQQ